MVTIEVVRDFALALPRTTETRLQGDPAFRVHRKLFARVLPGDILFVRVDMAHRRNLLRTKPETYFMSERYAGFPCVLVHLGWIEEEEMRALLIHAWRLIAGVRIIAAFDAEAPTSLPPIPPAKSQTKCA
jgi:hypothetical protein